MNNVYCCREVKRLTKAKEADMSYLQCAAEIAIAVLAMDGCTSWEPIENGCTGGEAAAMFELANYIYTDVMTHFPDI